jgi:hypothetical protein
LSEIESFQSVSIAEKHLQEAIHDGTDAKIVEMLRQVVEWRKCRQSRPRCLRCHSEDAIPIDEIIGFVHPDCGGTLESGEASIIHFSTDWVHYLTPEGLCYEIDSLKRVALFVSKATGAPVSRLQKNTLLENDLEITGAKAIQLITAFGQEFDVDLSAFQYLNHFTPTGRLSGFTPPNETDPISLRRLARAAQIGEWV